MLGICPDAVLEYIVIFAIKWASRHLLVKKPTKEKLNFYYFHRINLRFSINGDEGIVYLLIDSMGDFIECCKKGFETRGLHLSYLPMFLQVLKRFG